MLRIDSAAQPDLRKCRQRHAPPHHAGQHPTQTQRLCAAPPTSKQPAQHAATHQASQIRMGRPQTRLLQLPRRARQNAQQHGPTQPWVVKFDGALNRHASMLGTHLLAHLDPTLGSGPIHPLFLKRLS